MIGNKPTNFERPAKMTMKELMASWDMTDNIPEIVKLVRSMSREAVRFSRHRSDKAQETAKMLRNDASDMLTYARELKARA